MKGKILGSRYQVTKYLAEGGFGKTYLAEDTHLPQRDLCIVKQLSPSFNAPRMLKIARRLFKTEAKALHSLGHHPQIPELLAYFEEASKFYLVQQYIEGRTLDRELTRNQAWATDKVVELLRDCLGILQFIHERRVIHRDLKPANLIRRHADNKIVLVDFGAVKEILQGQTTLAQLTVAVGTQGYMPLEQARGKPRSSSDLYALGIIAIQALTGISPLTLEEDKNGEITWSHLAHTDRALIEIVTKMTRPYYGDRYQSAQSILEALDSCANTSINLPQRAIAHAPPVARLGVANRNQRPRSLQREQPDLNALPGVRSVAIVPTLTRDRVKPKLANQRLWTIVLISILASGGIYLFGQRLVIKPSINRSQPNTTIDR